MARTVDQVRLECYFTKLFPRPVPSLEAVLRLRLSGCRLLSAKKRRGPSRLDANNKLDFPASGQGLENNLLGLRRQSPLLA